MRDATGRDLGTLTLANTTGGLMLSGALHGLPPGTHGIHLHTTGRCEPPFTTAGGHWNPMGRMHGTQNPQGPHLGDMPNIVVSSDGIAAVSVTTPGGTLLGTDALLDADGAAVVIHESADDYRTDPSGNSGARIACGVVRGS
jgi:superoxide dismutase, Cu-Zn family